MEKYPVLMVKLCPGMDIVSSFKELNNKRCFNWYTQIKTAYQILPA